jgi:hypothetical protein
MSKPGISINLPPRVDRGDTVKAADFNSIRQAVARLARSGTPELPRIMPTTYKHPWKLMVSEEDGDILLRVYHGAISVIDWNGSKSLPEFFSMIPTIGMDRLSGDPFATTEGSLTLATNNTYGVWLKLSRSSGTNTNSPDPTEYGSVNYYGFANSAEIITDTTSNTPSLNMPFSASFAYIFIGQVAITAAGVVTIKQWRRSDVVIPMAMTLPNDIEHPET